MNKLVSYVLNKSDAYCLEPWADKDHARFSATIPVQLTSVIFYIYPPPLKFYRQPIVVFVLKYLFQIYGLESFYVTTEASINFF